jgi:hypothetical protein
VTRVEVLDRFLRALLDRVANSPFKIVAVDPPA